MIAKAEHDSSLRITAGKYPLSPRETDAYLIDSSQMKKLLEPTAAYSFRIPLPVFVYGSSRFVSRALNAGAADFLVEPIDFTELKARVLHHAPPPVLHLGDFSFRIGSSGLHPYGGSYQMEARGSGTMGGFVPLTFQQIIILKILLIHIGRPVYREALQYALWGEIRSGSRAVDMHVSALRKKLHALHQALSSAIVLEPKSSLEADTEHKSRSEAEITIEPVRKVGYRLIQTHFDVHDNFEKT